MEIYRALSDFTPPDTEGSQNILSFQKGDKFEIFDCHKQTDWWGARSLKDNTIGYVPCKYLQHEERKIGKLIPASDNLNEHKEKTLRRFADMQNQVNHKHPDELWEPQPPETPQPDYDIDSPSDKSLLFVKRFSNVLNSINLIDDLNAEIPEPDPDYEGDESGDVPGDSFPPPPPPIGQDEGDYVPQNGQSHILFPRVRPPSLSEAESEEVMIRPRKLPNPCVVSKERQALHRELLLNYKLGKNVLQKPELSKKLMDRRLTQKKKEDDLIRSHNRTSFELKLEERKTKLQEEESLKTIAENSESKPELARMYAKIRNKHDN